MFTACNNIWKIDMASSKIRMLASGSAAGQSKNEPSKI